MPNFPIDPTGFRMPNSGLNMGAKHGTPIQKNYGKGMPLTEGGKKSIMASNANPEFKAAIAKSDVDSPNVYASPAKTHEEGHEPLSTKAEKGGAKKKTVQHLKNVEAGEQHLSKTTDPEQRKNIQAHLKTLQPLKKG